MNVDKLTRRENGQLQWCGRLSMSWSRHKTRATTTYVFVMKPRYYLITSFSLSPETKWRLCGRRHFSNRKIYFIVSGFIFLSESIDGSLSEYDFNVNSVLLIMNYNFSDNDLIPSRQPDKSLACCPRAPNHYLSQCWLIISEGQCYASECYFTRDTYSSITKFGL